MFAHFSNTVVRVLLAPACAGCGVLLSHPLSEVVCANCWRGVEMLSPPWCEQCGDRLAQDSVASKCGRCLERPRSFERARSAGIYDGTLRDLIHTFKYQRRRQLSRPLARLMARTAEVVLADADALVPVPLHPRRYLARGFNQADDLAREFGLSVWRVLRRRRHGVPQAGLPAERRLDNVRGAFGLRARWTTRPFARTLHNRTLVLIDDVMTTGATVEACSEALLGAGARQVRVLTVARAVAAPRPPPPPPLPPSTVRRR